MSKLDRSRIAIMNIHYQYHPLHVFMEAMERHDIANIDLWAGYPHFLVNEATFDDAARLRREIRRRGLRLICFTPKQGGYPINIAADDASLRQQSLDYLIKCVEMAAELEAPMLQLLPGWGFYNEAPDAARERSCEGLRRIADRAGALGVTSVLEHLQLIESNLALTCFDLRTMIRQVDSPHLKAVVDTCHMAVAGETLGDYFAELGDDLIHVHLNDSDQLPLGEGRLPIGDYVRQLEQQSYAGYVSLEICSRKHYIDPDASLRTSLHTLDRLLH
ncbi:sugar phosphate isomerase/epimerase family protein [Paenibacillus sp. 1P07SE]|uniref:sugar phosphate isomerase/epimerase family protein n=1 Tax=Paenibacillus sp. 1P07SE TaxID=3132209 RepID=UPI0039A64FA0